MNKQYSTLLRRSYALAMGALLTLGICGCAATDLTEEPGIAPETGKFTLTATLASGASTRIEHAEGNDGLVKATWKVGDVIGIKGEYDKEPLPFTCIAVADGGNTGTFIGDTAPRMTYGNYGITYPVAIKKVDISTQIQTGNASMAHLGEYDIIGVGVPDWKNFSFKNTSRYTALMTFDLTDIPADLGTPQSITLGCTGANSVFYTNLDFVSAATLALGLSDFAAPTGATVDIKAYLMLIGGTKIPKDECLTITVKGSGGSYTFTSPKMADDKYYERGMRYTATVGAGQWTKVFSGDTYTGAEAAEAFTTGDGSAAKPYEISSAGQLRTLIDNVSTYDGTYFKLMTDINIAMAGGGAWTPIGASISNIFRGYFDGNGHTISGTMTGTADNFGFFGHTSGATISNLTVDATVSGGKYVGGIVGRASASTRISNCTNKGAVTAENGYGGGIGGYVIGTTISNCTNQGAIVVTVGSGHGGGIAGTIELSSIILGCVNEGTVLGIAGQSFGGIAGSVTGKISIIACYNTAAVTTPAYYGGGIAGKLASSSITTACYNTGKIAQADNKTNNIGTIAGQNPDGCTVSYCQWVLDAENAGLPAFPTGNAGTDTKNTVRELATLNDAGVAALNAGIAAWNKTNAAGSAKHCPFSFVTGTTAGPTLAPGAPPAPPSSSGGVGDIGDGDAALPQ